jgi:hypothetical protein
LTAQQELLNPIQHRSANSKVSLCIVDTVIFLNLVREEVPLTTYMSTFIKRQMVIACEGTGIRNLVPPLLFVLIVYDYTARIAQSHPTQRPAHDTLLAHTIAGPRPRTNSALLTAARLLRLTARDARST